MNYAYIIYPIGYNDKEKQQIYTRSGINITFSHDIIPDRVYFSSDMLLLSALSYAINSVDYNSGATAFARHPTSFTCHFSLRIVSRETCLHFSNVAWKSASMSGMQSVSYM